MKIKSLMTRNLITLSPLMEIAAAARLLTEHGITGAPVVDSKGELLGVVSQTDLTRFQGCRPPLDAWASVGPQALRDQDRQSTPLVVVMTDDPVTCDEEDSVKDVAALMLKRRIHRVIVTKQGKLTGIVTSMDLLKAVPSA